VPTSLAEIRDRAQLLYDISGSEVLSAPQWDVLCNSGYRALWAEVVSRHKNFRINVDPFTLTTTQTRALPADYRETFLVRLNPGTENQVILSRFTPRIAASLYERSYRLQGTNLVIEPLQRCAGTFDHLYIPTCPVLTLDADELDAELDQFVDYVVYKTTILALTREESEIAQWGALLGDELARVIRWASNQRSAEPDVVDDVRRSNTWNRGSLP
jgi:hypothetical protein